ncbi:TPA: hypothetical protein ONC43_004788, partial [Enterobacter hormaechei subsp. steigerwaltii]|nr:hypothetical protein [Enterobacter hormaechei subsp. steigerwaltii]
LSIAVKQLAAPAACFLAFARKFFLLIPLLKSQISRSAPPLMATSKIFTNIFRTANNLTHCKKTNHVHAGDELQPMANIPWSCDRATYFEQDLPRSGHHHRAVRRSDHCRLV